MSFTVDYRGGDGDDLLSALLSSINERGRRNGEQGPGFFLELELRAAGQGVQGYLRDVHGTTGPDVIELDVATPAGSLTGEIRTIPVPDIYGVVIP